MMMKSKSDELPLNNTILIANMIIIARTVFDEIN